MYTHLRTEIVKRAKKQYKCDICMSIMELIGNSNQVKEELSGVELELWESMESKDFTIQIGEPYIRIIGVFEGDLVVNHYSSEQMLELGKRFGIFEN